MEEIRRILSDLYERPPCPVSSLPDQAAHVPTEITAGQTGLAQHPGNTDSPCLPPPLPEELMSLEHLH